MAPKLNSSSKSLIDTSDQMVKKGGRSRASSRRRVEEEKHGEKIHEKKVERDEAPSRPTRRSRVDPYGTDIFRSGLATRPKNPYYVAKIDLNHPNSMFVSKDVFGHRIFDLPENPLISGPSGRKWRTKLSTWKDGRKVYKGGWNYFRMNNEIQEDDLYIIEFVPRSTGATDIQVNIVRADRSSSSK